MSLKFLSIEEEPELEVIDVPAPNLSVATEGIAGAVIGFITGAVTWPLVGINAAAGAGAAAHAAELKKEIKTIADALQEAAVDNGRKAVREGKLTAGDFSKLERASFGEVLKGAIGNTLFGPIYGAIKGSEIENLRKELKEKVEELNNILKKQAQKQGIGNEVLDDADMELPGEFTQADDLALLEETAIALEGISTKLALEGMDVGSARELEKVSPGFLRASGGIGVYTSRPSLEGLADAATAVKDRLVAILAQIRKSVTELYKRFAEWLRGRAEKSENLDVTQEVKDFVASRQNLEAMKFIAGLPETPEDAAHEVATFAGGETATFAGNLADQFQSMGSQFEKIEKMMLDNPTQYRLAKGLVTVDELFSPEATKSLTGTLKMAAAAADNAMKSRDSNQFMEALSKIDEVNEQLDEFQKNVVLNTTPSEERGDDKGVSIDKLYENVSKAVNDFNRVSLADQTSDVVTTFLEMIKLGSETAIEEVVEMIPEDVPAQQRNSYAQKVVSLYRKIAAIGQDTMSLWRIRLGAVASINAVGKALVGLVDSFEKAVSNAGSSLEQEQKDKLVKGLAGKGLVIEF